VLRKIQRSFDPTGICSRDLKECLRIQAEDLGYKSDDIIIKIIENSLEYISKKDYKQVADVIGVKAEDVEKAACIISSFEPKPGRPFYAKDSEKYVMPDFYVYQIGNDLRIQLNRDFPRIRVSQYYRDLVKQRQELSRDTKKYIKEKLEAAQRIVKCLEERDETIRKVISEIVNVQRDFFEHGKGYIKPLRLKDIAQTVSVHESTVSRITSRRYIQTPQGTVELKALFSRKIETSHGGDLSFERVKTIIKEIIADEPPESPYSDEDISKILERRSIKVARRTVAKYRKILQIPSSSERAAENSR
jgi:RNA polymerase sigma-54 factor